MEEDFEMKEKVVEDVGKVEDGREKDMEVDCEVKEKVDEDDGKVQNGGEEGIAPHSCKHYLTYIERGCSRWGPSLKRALPDKNIYMYPSQSGKEGRKLIYNTLTS